MNKRAASSSRWATRRRQAAISKGASSIVVRPQYKRHSTGTAVTLSNLQFAFCRCRKGLWRESACGALFWRDEWSSKLPVPPGWGGLDRRVAAKRQMIKGKSREEGSQKDGDRKIVRRDRCLILLSLWRLYAFLLALADFE